MKNITLTEDQNQPSRIYATLPEIIRSRAALCARERNVPFDLPLLAILAAISTSAGKGVVIHSGRERETRANLYILAGVSSGIGKSEVFRDLFGPILNFEKALHAWWQLEPSPRARAGEEMLKARVTELRKLSREYPRLGLEIFREMHRNEIKRDTCRAFLEPPCLLADDATPEALGQLMQSSQESIAMVSPDARYLLKRLSRPDSKEENFILKSFSGDLSLTSRVTRKATRLASPCLTTLLLTQTDAYDAFLKKARQNRSGILPRFLHSAIVSDPVEMPDVDLRRAPKIRSNYAEILRQNIEAFRFEREPVVIEASQDAKAFILEVEELCRNSTNGGESAEDEIRRRKAEMIWRVALCLHLARYGNTSAVKPLELGSAECALQIVDYYTQI